MLLVGIQHFEAAAQVLFQRLFYVADVAAASHFHFQGSAAALATVLEREGYIQGFKVLDGADGVNGGAKSLRLFLKYGPHGERLITGVERISRPGRRVYFGRDDVPEVLAGLGTSILTTSRGVMTGRNAVKAGVGGEVLCNIW